MRVARVVLLFALANVAAAACLFPSFDGFHESTTSSSSGSGVTTGSGGGTHDAGTGAGGSTGTGGGSGDPCYLDDDPVAVWPFDDGSGTTARECRGKYAATLEGAATWTAGRHGASAILFQDPPDGSDVGAVLPPSDAGALVVGGRAGQNPKPFSVAAWFKSPDAPNFNFPRYLVSRSAWNFSVNGNVRYDAGIDDFGIVLGMRIVSAQHMSDPHTTGVFALHGWTHAAVTYDGDVTLMFYLNGELADSNPFDAGDYATSDQRLVMGSDGTGFAFVGAISEVRLYDRQLTAPEVAKIAKR